MKERILNLSVNENDVLVKIDNELESKTVAKINDIYHLMKHIHDCIISKKLTEGDKSTFLSLSESYIKELGGLLDYEGVLAQEAEERYKKIRELNIENRALRKQLGTKVTNEDLRERLKNISADFHAWWNIYGFGHLRELSFSEYGTMVVKLSGMISDPYYLDGIDISNEQKVAYLKKLGFEISGKSRDSDIIHNDKNIELLKQLLSKFPSMVIHKINTFFGKSISKIREIEVYIKDLDDLDCIKDIKYVSTGIYDN